MIQKPIPDDINPPSRIGSIMPIQSGEEHAPTAGQSFSSLMQNVSGAESQTSKSQMISPFDLANTTQRGAVSQPSLGTLEASVKLAQNTMADLQTQLNSPDMKLKASQKYVVQNKLEEANGNLRAANAKLGTPAVDPAQKQPSTGPLAKFLDYVSDGMNQIEAAKKQVGALKENGTDLKPADFLLIQLKMNKAQQELDFTSILLSKAVEGVKMLMNVQI
ncbi:MAG: hypothetical protein FJZ57_04400 [Chlamydiae bacterium]|nr:hypothetical protein [Chlamydiota bacterium]